MAAAYSHVIFDLDGTILNTLEDLAAAGNHTCEMHGWPTFAVDEYRYKVGNGMLKLVERFMPAEYAGDGRMFEQTLAEFRAYYDEDKGTATAEVTITCKSMNQIVEDFATQYQEKVAALDSMPSDDELYKMAGQVMVDVTKAAKTKDTKVTFKYSCNDDGEWSADDSATNEMMNAMMS